MTLRNQLIGNSLHSFRAISGHYSLVNLTTMAFGNTQNAYVAGSDYQVVNGATAGNLTITLPNPYLQGLMPGDSYQVINSATGVSLSIYPPTGGNISGAGTNTAVTLANNKQAWYILISYTSTSSVWVAANSA